MEYLNLSSSQNWTLEYPKQLVPPLRITHFRRFWGAFSEPPMLSLVIQCHALPLITHRPNFFWIHDRRPKRHLDCLNLTNWATQKWGTSGRTNRDGHCIKLVLVFNHPIFICRWSIMLIKYDQILFPQTWPTLHFAHAALVAFSRLHWMLRFWVPGNWASPKTYTGTILALEVFGLRYIDTLKATVCFPIPQHQAGWNESKLVLKLA